MRFSTIIATAASASMASARIVGIACPKTIKAGEPFDMVIRTENYIQSIYDVSIAYGIAEGEGYPESLGTILDSKYLGPALSNVDHNITFPVTIPSSLDDGKYLFSASLFSLLGAVYGPNLENFNVSVSLGAKTSGDYVESKA